MAVEIRQFTILIPPGTAQAAPFGKDLSFPARTVQRVEIRVPPGPSGLVGFALQNSGVTVIPYGSDAFIVTADENIVWDLEGFVTSGSWQVIGYNTDNIAHAVYVRFLLNPPPTRGGVAAATIDESVLNASAAAGPVSITEGGQ